MDSKKKIIIAVIIGLVLLTGGYFGYTSYSYSSSHEETDNANIEGNIIPIIPRTSGYITKINISDNQDVKAGDTLFKIDDRELKTKLEQAEAALKNAEANVISTESLIQTGYANLSVSKENAEAAKENIDNAKARFIKVNSDFERYSHLLTKKSVTQQQFESVQSDKVANQSQLAASEKQYSAARNQIIAAQSQIASYEKQVGVAKSTLKQRQEDLEFAKLQYSYATVIAPESGHIYKRNIQIGQYVQPGGQLFYLIPSSKMWVIANYKETQVKDMEIGQKAELNVDALGGKSLKGTVLSFAKSTGSRLTLLPPDNATGNFVKVVQRIPVKISIEDSDQRILNKLSVGMNVVVSVKTK